MKSAARAESALEALIDLGLERAVLGNALIDPVAVPTVADVPLALFHKDAHRAVAAAIRACAARGETVEPGTLRLELERMDRWGDVGFTLLATLEEEATVSTMLPVYVQTLRELAARRELVRIARGVGHEALDRAKPLDSILAGHLAAVGHLEEQGAPSGIMTPAQLAAEMVAVRALDRIATGLTVYDLEGGLTVGDLHTLAARPRMGKSVAGVQIVHHAATVLGLPALFVSLEMSRRQVELRMLGAGATPAEVGASGLHIVDPVGTTGPELVSIIRRAVAQYAIQLVVVDHLQQIQADPSKRWERKDLEIRDVCTRLADTARALDVPILALAQINRAGAANNAAKPSLEHLQDGGAIEQLSATVTMLYTQNGEEDTDDAVIPVTFAQRKNRHEGVKIWRASFHRPHRFEAA